MCNYDEKEPENVVVVGIVMHHEAIAKDVYKMTIGGEKLLKICQKAKAGQFINVYLKDKSTLLPRPISICQIDKESLDIVYKVVGKGTEGLSHYKEGEDIRISSGLGMVTSLMIQKKTAHGYRVTGKKNVCLLGVALEFHHWFSLQRSLKIDKPA